MQKNTNFKLVNVDLTNVFDTFGTKLKKKDVFEDSEDSKINLKPRLRMASLYYIAQMYSIINKKPCIVAGTGNKWEKYVGYFTKCGDGVCDIDVIADFTVEDVIKLGEVLQVPEEVIFQSSK